MFFTDGSLERCELLNLVDEVDSLSLFFKLPPFHIIRPFRF